jgi:predicted acylesterase/phospholipase RssA
MPIKHLVIAGGGPLGLCFLGALEHLHEQKVWNIEDIQSVYATSIGTIIGAFICLKYDWETLNKYIIERPWHDAFKVTGKQIFDAYRKKGLFDKKLAEIIFSPLLKAKDLELNITLKEFYEYSKIEFHLYAFELNKFETCDFSYKTHPELGLMQALTMSCALPGIFMPICIENGCYIDGGVMCNFPSEQCLHDHPGEEDEILGINKMNHSSEPHQANINEDSSILDFIVGFSINAMNYICNSVKKAKLKNEVICYSDGKELTLEVIKESISNMEMRKTWLKKGQKYAEEYLNLNLNVQNKDTQINI